MIPSKESNLFSSSTIDSRGRRHRECADEFGLGSRANAARCRRNSANDFFQHMFDGQVAHAAMMSQRADSLLTRTTIDGPLQMHGQRMKRFAPSDVRRTEQRDARHMG